MAIPSQDCDLNIEYVADVFSKEGCMIKEKDDMILVMVWKNMETTVYPQGKIMFFPLRDKRSCIDYATEILSKLQ
jgi:hypothetical protein